MKRCKHCGAENKAEASHCRECETEFGATGQQIPVEKEWEGLMRPLMHRSVPPKRVVMLALAAVSVELPLFVAFLLVRWSQHFGPEWLNWPVFAGLFPMFVATCVLKLVHLSIHFSWFGCGVLTMGLIWLIFILSWRSSYWPRLLVAGFVISSVLTFLAFLGLRA